jgi:hypothetical protein
VHLGHLSLVYLYTLPFVLIGMSESLGFHHVLWVVSCIMLLVSYAFLGTEEISTMVENPFENRNECDLPIDEMCDQILVDAIRMVKWYEHVRFPSVFERIIKFNGPEAKTIHGIFEYKKEFFIYNDSNTVVATATYDRNEIYGLLDSGEKSLIVKLTFGESFSKDENLTIEANEDGVFHTYKITVTEINKKMPLPSGPRRLEEKWNIPKDKKKNVEELQQVLRGLKLIEYLDNFIEDGVECEEDLIHLDINDLMSYGLNKVNASKSVKAISKSVKAIRKEIPVAPQAEQKN